MSISSIQGHLLEVTVVACHKLKDTEWISRQDPYVCLEYASTKFRTRTCTDGGKNPVFQEKFVFTLIEGLREINVLVWNSNTLTFDDFIGSGKVQLQDVLSRGYDDRSWPLQTKTGRYAGEVKLIMHYANANKPATGFNPSAPPYSIPSQPHIPMYAPPAATSVSHTNSTPSYPPPPSAYAPPTTAHPPPPSAYPATSPYAYPPPTTAYPPTTSYPPYPYPAYPPASDQPAYPPAAYPPPPSAYPPPPHVSSYYHSGHYPGVYPPPPH